MNKQMNMWGSRLQAAPYGGAAPSVSGDTSEGAARSIQPVLGALQARMLGWVRSKGNDGSTCDEAEEGLDMKHQTASARLRELVLKEFIVDSGMRRRTRSGRGARVYVVLEGSAV